MMVKIYYQNENFNEIYDFRCREHIGFAVASHIHEYSEILYCKKGNCDVIINEKIIRLTSDEFVFIPPNYIHCYNFKDDRVICAVFSNDFIPLYFKMTHGKQLTINAMKADELKNIFIKLPKIDVNNTILISAYLNLICSKVIEQSVFEKRSASDSVLYQKIISYISESFREDISLEKTAAKFGYNKKYLSHTLHSLTNTNFSDFVAMYRIEYAMELLTNNKELSITEISAKCGFSAINTFNRQFKKITNMTPTDYRKCYDRD